MHCSMVLAPFSASHPFLLAQMFSKSQSHFYLLVHIRRPKKVGYVSKSKPQIPHFTKFVFVNLTGRSVRARSLSASTALLH